MKKNKYALVIGASIESIFAIKTAQELGYKVIAFDGNIDAPGLKYADNSYITDITNPKNIIDILTKENIYPQIVLPVPIGRYLITTGAINDYYGLVGPTLRNADICTDKYLFHKILYESNLRNIFCKCIKKREDINASDLIYPCILKPRFGSGSRNVFAILSENDFNKNIESLLPYNEDMIVETLVGGVEFGVDGVVLNGQYKQVLLREKSNTDFPYRQCIGYYSVTEKNLYNKIEKFMQEIISALNLKNCLLHADLIYNQKTLFIIELSPRPSGHNLHNKFTILATGVNMIKEYIYYVNGEKYSFLPKYNKNLLMRFYDFENCKIIKVPDFINLKEEFNILDYKCNIEKNERLSIIKDGHSIIDRGYIIIEGENRSELKTKSEKIMNMFIKE